MILLNLHFDDPKNEYEVNEVKYSLLLLHISFPHIQPSYMFVDSSTSLTQMLYSFSSFDGSFFEALSLPPIKFSPPQARVYPFH